MADPGDRAELNDALQAARALRQAGQLDEAEQLLGRTVAQFPQDPSPAIQRAWLANARRDWPTALRRWEFVRQHFPDNAWGYLGSAQALRACGHADQADELLAVAEAMAADGGESAAATKLQLEIARARGNWNGVKQAAQRLIAHADNTPAAIHLVLAQACWHLRERAAAERAAQDALAAEPGLADAVLVQAWIATEAGDGVRAIECYRRLAELDPAAVRWPLKVVHLLNWLGQVDEAVRELEKVQCRWPDDPAVQRFVRNYGPAAPLRAGESPAGEDARSSEELKLQNLAGAAPPPAQRLRAVLVDNPARDLLTVQVPGAATALLVFAGSNDAVAVPLTCFDLYLAALPLAVVYLKDFRRLRFLAGVRSLGADYQATLAALRGLLTGLGVSRICALGNCDGACAAIRYGVELGAERILAFNTPTHSPRGDAQQFEQARNFKRVRMAALGMEDASDLKPFLASRQHGSRIELFYEHEDPRDRAHALHLAEAPGVSLHPRPGSSNHRLLRDVALASGDFRALLAELLGLERGDSAERRA